MQSSPGERMRIVGTELVLPIAVRQLSKATRHIDPIRSIPCIPRFISITRCVACSLGSSVRRADGQFPRCLGCSRGCSLPEAGSCTQCFPHASERDAVLNRTLRSRSPGPSAGTAQGYPPWCAAIALLSHTRDGCKRPSAPGSAASRRRRKKRE